MSLILTIMSPKAKEIKPKFSFLLPKVLDRRKSRFPSKKGKCICIKRSERSVSGENTTIDVYIVKERGGGDISNSKQDKPLKATSS